MLDNNLNSNNSEEVVQPPQDSNSVEVVQPQEELTPESINDMTSEEFKSYLAELGNKPDEAEETVMVNNKPSEITHEAEENSAEEAEVVNQEVREENTDVPSAESQVSPFRVFNTESEFDDAMNARFRERMKKHNEKIDKYSALEEMAKSFYPDAEDPISAMQLDLEEQAAEKMNVTADEVRSRTQDKLDAQKYRQQQKEVTERQDRTNEIISGWERDAEQIKFINPDFDLRDAMKNPEFKNILSVGGTVAQAYSQVYKSAPPKAQERKQLVQNGQTSKLKGSGITQVDPSKLSTKQFMDYINKRRNA